VREGRGIKEAVDRNVCFNVVGDTGDKANAQKRGVVSQAVEAFDIAVYFTFKLTPRGSIVKPQQMEVSPSSYSIYPAPKENQKGLMPLDHSLDW
jgi:hypothetical protein